MAEVKKRGKDSSIVQSVVFRKKYFTKEKARKWLRENKMRPIKQVEEKENTYRYRLRDPDKYKIVGSKFIKGATGVLFVFGIPK
jgi:hypothetical protein